MTNLLYLTRAFNSIIGPVQSEDISKSLQLMGKGMFGIFIVMLLIYALIACLNHSTSNKKDE